MKNYESYTMVDFIQDEDFRDWVQGQKSRETFWMSFTEKYPDKKDMLRQAEHLIRAAHVNPERITEKEIRSEVELFIERATTGHSRTDIIEERHRLEKKLYWYNILRWGLSAAAMVLVAVGINWYLRAPNEINPGMVAESRSNSNMVLTSNDTEKPLRILLVDSSEVILNPKSRLSYPVQFSDSARVVYLVGEASFSVKRQGQPFMVYTGEVVTRVLGTRFVIRAFDLDKKITVQVQTGKVSVYVAKPKQVPNKKEVNGLIITANQEAVFEKSISQLSKTVVANPLKLTKEAPLDVFKYEEVPLPSILRELEKTYGIPVQFDEENFQSCKITATLSNESLYEKLDVLCKAVAASYEIVDGQIVLSGKGCRQ
jgi:transmembrane sensor